MFPIEKYHFIKTRNKIIAMSTFAGKTVKGVAKLNPKDEYDEEFGKRLAAARCNLKIAQKRCKRASKKLQAATDLILKAEVSYYDAEDYFKDARYDMIEAERHISRLLSSR